MRIVRRILAATLLPIIVVAGTLVGTFLALTWTPPGRRLSARAATDWITASVAGRVQVGSIRGNLLTHVVIAPLRIEDSTGALLATAARVEASYTLPELFAGRIVFRNVRVDSLVAHLVRLRRGRWNLEEIFHLGHSGPNRGPGTRVEFHDVQLVDADLRVDVPTHAQPPRQPVSRHGAPPAQRRVESSSDGLVRVYSATGLTARFPLLRISTPDRAPALVRVADLQARLSDPALTITHLKGEFLTAGDSLIFTVDPIRLPNTTARGGGAVRWPDDQTMFDFALNVEAADLADLLWISPDFPRWQGRAQVTAFSPTGRQTRYDLQQLTLGDGVSSATGHLVAVDDDARGLGVANLDLQLRKVPLEVMRPYLDTLPFRGTVTGPLQADGFLDDLSLTGDLDFADSLVAGAPHSQLALAGRVHFGGPAGAVFERMHLNGTRLAMGTVHRVLPSVILPGTLRLAGQLDGAWLNADFAGAAELTAPDSSLSRMVGRARFDARRALLAVDIDADLDPLSFAQLRSGYPTLAAHGSLTGHLRLLGPLDSLEVDADVAGEIGSVRAKGRMALLTPRYAADSLRLDLVRFDTRAFSGEGNPTALTGHLLLHGTVDSGVPPIGTADIALDRSRVGGITFDAASATLRAAEGLLHVDSASVIWPDGSGTASGTLGLTPADSGTLVMKLRAGTLLPFDSLLRAATHLPADTIGPRPFDGRAEATVIFRGALPAPGVTASFDADSVAFDRWRMGVLHATLSADSLGARAMTVHAAIDSLGFGSRAADHVVLDLAGRRDSLAYQGMASLRDLNVASTGSWQAGDSTDVLQLDSLALDFPRQRWRLTRPTALRLGGAATALREPIALATRDGGGSMLFSGSVPGSGPGELDIGLAGVDLVDVYGLLQRDTTSLAGWLALDARLGGTLERPTLRGSGAITGMVTADVRAPLIHADFDYQDRRLQSRLTIWRTGDPILEVDVSLPYDLALARRAERKLPGPISFTAVADSVDLLMLEALTPSLRSTTGSLHADIQGSGTWTAPRLGGNMEVRDGGMSIPGLNVRYGRIQGRARFSGDSMLVDSLRLRSGPGTLDVTGSVEFPQLTSPVLDLRLRADNFLAMNVPSYLTLQSTGDVTLTGPLWQAELGGRGTVSNSVLYFADLIAKDVLDLEDPALADLVDQEALRRQGLGAQFQNRFLDSLRIRNLAFQLGSDVWLRSDEANIQLEGSVTVNKVRRRYLLDGAFTTPRGDYTLKVGPIRRDFTVESGTVTYQGTPDLNALLDIQATHTIRTVTGDEIPVVARINGSLLVPKLTLTSPSRSYGEFELMSYLLFGTPPDQVTSQGGREVLQLASATLSSEVSRTLVRSGLPLDLLQFRASPDGSSLTQLVAGRQLAPKWFLTFNVGFCFGAQSQGFSAKNLGASLEYRINRSFKLQASAEPVQSCLTNRTSDFFTTLNRYQLGGDLLWQRDY